HPRYTESQKTYTYNILNSPVDIPIYSRYMHHVRGALDIEKMKEAAKYIVGEHDFSAFCSAGAQVKTKIRTIYNLDIKKNASNISITVTGNGFLYNMVRIIAGTLIEVGQGRRTPESVKKAIDEKNRELAGPTAPAKGLVLKEIRYL
ncbi:MAG: tRNA pseudouridine(38-40) synthase TruA, partial [Eubacterium sp.]|nr:tRNA pseudouridine(38-40) synthase TruA [Eubacterium sp.]